MTRTITAIFDSADQAEQALRNVITEVAGVRGTIYSSRSGDTSAMSSIPEDDRAVLEEGIRRGNAVFYGTVPDDRYEAAADFLEQRGAVDIDEREAKWRQQGWTGTPTTAATARQGDTASAAASTAPTAPMAATGSARQNVGQVGAEQVIPIVEERLRVGKRETGQGRVRVRSYVVETPVEEQVTLHREHVQVDRHAVDRPLSAADDAVFAEKTIEATETSEEAVIAKEARVKEEVVISKTAEEHTQTVSDTVRRTEVEIDDQRGRATTPTTPQRTDKA